jgi:hypothetical protein
MEGVRRYYAPRRFSGDCRLHSCDITQPAWNTTLFLAASELLEKITARRRKEFLLPFRFYWDC